MDNYNLAEEIYPQNSGQIQKTKNTNKNSQITSKDNNRKLIRNSSYEISSLR